MLSTVDRDQTGTADAGQGRTVAMNATTSNTTKAAEAEAQTKAVAEMLARIPESLDLAEMPETILRDWQRLDAMAHKAEGEAEAAEGLAEAAKAKAAGMWQGRARWLATVHVRAGFASIARVCAALDIDESTEGETVRLSVSAGLLMLADPSVRVGSREGQRVGLKRAQAAYRAAHKAALATPDKAEAAKRVAVAKAAETIAKAEAKAEAGESVDLPKVRAEAEAKAKREAEAAEAKAAKAAKAEAAKAVAEAKRKAAEAARKAAEAEDKRPAEAGDVDRAAKAVAKVIARAEANGWTESTRDALVAMLAEATTKAKATKATAEAKTA